MLTKRAKRTFYETLLKADSATGASGIVKHGFSDSAFFGMLAASATNPVHGVSVGKMSGRGEHTALERFIEGLKRHRGDKDAVAYHRHIVSRPPEFGPQPTLDPRLKARLSELGIPRLYSHQVEAIEHIRQGNHVIVATPTASGKSLIYNLAVLETALRDPDVRAVYVFPLKALEQDQMKNLRPWLDMGADEQIRAEIYDGDTSAYRRKKIRTAPPQILFTTPDMLHQGILAFHEGWEGLLGHLRYVILDEVHTYRGIFGSHVNQVIRRLKRLCRHYGSAPRFVLLSATVSNPKEFAKLLIGEDVAVVANMGAPVAGRHFLFVNPVESANFTAARLFVQCVQQGFRTIAFAQSRKVTELIHIWVSRMAPRLRNKISSYRAGFMPEERRDIEKRLAAGDLLGVVSTSALEMGIDIGYLDICLLVGYPGTVIDTWQRGGRVGRTGRESAVILIGKPDALDQYFMKHPEDFFQRSYEAAVLDPENSHVMDAHLPCAAAEEPLTRRDRAFWPAGLVKRLEALEHQGALRRTAEDDPMWFASARRPHRRVNMRSAGETFVILEKGSGKPIGTVDGVRAFKECHPGAVYLHRGLQYLVDAMDLSRRNITAHVADVRYFTRVKSDKETQILETHRSRPQRQFVVREGRLRVTEVITGYEKRALPGQTLLGTGSLDLPPNIFETVGLWIEIRESIRAYVEQQGLHFMGGIHAIEHAAIGMFPLFCLCDRDDIGGIAYPFHPEVGNGAIFIYDGYPGGVGLAQHGFEIIVALLEKTAAHLKSCGCENGCPSCIHSPKCGSGNKPLDKKAADVILDVLLGQIPLSRVGEGRPEKKAPPVSPPARGPEPQESSPRILFFDLETQRTAQDVGGWANVALMLISVAVVFDSLDDTFRTYEEDRIEALLDDLETADLVVGFNVKRFDYRVLGAYTGRALERLPTFDILEDIYRRLGFRLSLDHLASETLNHPKTADGLQAVAWFTQGEMEKLAEYCRNDVAITRDLFYYGLENQELIYREKRRNQRMRLPVDWDLARLIENAPNPPPRISRKLGNR